MNFSMRGFCRDRSLPESDFTAKMLWKQSYGRAGYYIGVKSRPVEYRRVGAVVGRFRTAPADTGAMSASSGGAMSPDKAGASIPTMAHGPNATCSKTGRISC